MDLVSNCSISTFRAFIRNASIPFPLQILLISFSSPLSYLNYIDSPIYRTPPFLGPLAVLSITRHPLYLRTRVVDNYHLLWAKFIWLKIYITIFHIFSPAKFLASYICKKCQNALSHTRGLACIYGSRDHSSTHQYPDVFPVMPSISTLMITVSFNS